MFGIVEEVSEELGFGRVSGEVRGEGELGQVAEVFGEVEGEAVVSAVAPEVSNAIRALEDEERDRQAVEGGSNRNPRWAGSDDDWPRHEGDFGISCGRIIGCHC